MCNQLLKLLGLSLLLSVTACQVKPNDDEEPELPLIEEYLSGIYVTNGGDSQQANSASVDFIDRATNQIVRGIFEKANGEEPPAGVRSIQIVGEKAYMLSANEGRLLVANATDFSLINSLGGLEQPRELLLVNPAKLYISQWGTNLQNGSIEVVDLASMTVSKSISTRNGPVKMVKLGSHVYVCQDGGIFADSVVSKINIGTDQLAKTIDVGVVPNSIVLDKNGALWVLSQGILNLNNPDEDVPGRLVKLVNDAPALSLELMTGARNLVIDKDRAVLYFTMNEWIYKHDVDENSFHDVPHIARSFTSIGIDPANGNLVAANSANLVSPGEIYLFDSQGMELHQFNCGIFPNGFGFR